MSLLTAKDVFKTYQTASGSVAAVRGVSFDVRPGRTLAIVGESGSGKSTLARMLVGLEKPDQGSISYQGKKSPIIPMVFQDSMGSLHARRTVQEIVVEPLMIRDGHWRMTAVLRDRGLELMKSVGLTPEFAGRFPHELSGGQRQRVNIARALALEPDVIVLDEPVSALDVSIQAQILNLLVRLQNEKGLAYIFISHDLSVVRHFAHDVLVLFMGEVVERGAVEAVLAKPAHPYTQTLLASEPTIESGLKALSQA